MTRHSAGFDLFADLEAELTLAPGKRELVPCGFAIGLPEGYEAQIRPRSGLAIKHGIGILNSPGTVDSDYRGEVKVILINLGEQPFTISPGMRIAQMVIAPVLSCQLEIVETLNQTSRGPNGFGHTGH